MKYKYVGRSSVVEVDYPTPQVKVDLRGGTPGTYTGLDRFGRRLAARTRRVRLG